MRPDSALPGTAAVVSRAPGTVMEEVRIIMVDNDIYGRASSPQRTPGVLRVSHDTSSPSRHHDFGAEIRSR